MNARGAASGTASDNQLTDMSAVKLALMAKQLRAQAGAVARAEPIAVIGMGCRFPGGANTLDRYWDLIANGVDAVGPLPRDRFDVDAFYDPDPATPGKMSVNSGGFVDGVDEFDADFFGIIGREAERMDPQHRMFLEVAIDALDHAGLPREQLAGSATGAFVANFYHDYESLQLDDLTSIDARTLTGTQQSVLVNRLSYVLDLRGPSVSIDTACSSSLVAVHLACQSLRAGECDIALAGGVSLMLNEATMVTLSKVGFLSPSGRCHTFDAAADGFVRGEGCGVVVLKRLADAVADDDRVLAVVRGSAVNQDGRSTVLTAPNGLAQQALVHDALAVAQIRPERVGYVEAHGTATPLGDPIEVEALAAVLGQPRDGAPPCYLGSVKANIGHLEAAAGIAGVIKTVLLLQHGQIAPQSGFTTLNPHLSLDGTRLRIASEATPWPPADPPRVAGVSSFGVGGTNAHVVIEEAPELAPIDRRPERPELLALSARSPAALHELATSWRDLLTATPEPAADLCAAAGTRRSHHPHRLAVVGATTDELARSLDAELRGPRPVIGTPSGGRTTVPFVFSGQGSQWARMAIDLAAAEPVVADVLADLDARFAALADWSLLDALHAPADVSRLDDTEVAQPAIFSVQVALAALWAAWGVRPSAVIGHSVGELAAFHVAGMLDRDEAVRIVWHRGRIMQRATGLGRMTAATLAPADAERLAAEIGDGLSLAAINAPMSVVLAGPVAAVDRCERTLGERNVRFRRLPVSYAFHSSQMDPLGDELVETLGTVSADDARFPVFSTVTGGRIGGRDLDAAYFGRNIRATVRFADALDAALSSGAGAVLEIAPHAVLAAAIAECAAAGSAAAAEPVVASSMRRDQPGRPALLAAAAHLYTAGVDLEWPALFPGPVRPLDLPANPWQRRTYWLPHRRPGRPVGIADPLLGRRSTDAGGCPAFEVDRPLTAAPWIADHVIGGQTVVPGTALLEAMRAASVAAGSGGSVRDFVILEPLVLDGDAAAGWRTIVTPSPTGAEIALWSAEAGRADRQIAQARADGSPIPAAAAAGGGTEPPLWGEWNETGDALYVALAALGATFGPAFRTVTRWRRSTIGTAAEGWLFAGSAAEAAATVLDGALQVCALAASDGNVAPDRLVLPLAIDAVSVLAPLPQTARAVAHVRERTDRGVTADVDLFDDEARLVARLDGARLAFADRAAVEALGRRPAPVHDVTWVIDDTPMPAGPSPTVVGTWLVVSCGPGGDALASAIHEALAPLGGAARVLPMDGNLDALRACIAAAAPDRPLRGVVLAAALDTDDADAAAVRERKAVGAALDTVHALDGASAVTLWWLTRNAQPAAGSVTDAIAAGVWGLAGVVERELPDLDLRVLDLPPHPVAGLADHLLDAGGPRRVALRGIDRWVPRVVPHGRSTPGLTGRDVHLQIDPHGTLDAISWADSPVRAPGAGEVRVRVTAIGLNFRDVLLALGMYPGGGARLGAECAGVVEACGAGVTNLAPGERVFGYAPGSLATQVIVPAHVLRPTPATMADDTAASLPVAHLTARYGLTRLAGIGPGSRVLVHAAAGGVGLAAVQCALAAGAEVFATAGSPAKRALIRAHGVAHVFDSRSTAFADEVRAVTGGDGVDVVLNSLNGDLIAAGVGVLAPGGCFLELGKRDVWTPERISSVRPDVRYHVYDLGDQVMTEPGLAGQMLDDVIADWSAGRLAALPTRTFDLADTPIALRTMAQARHVGKLVLRAPAPGDPTRVDPDATYLVTGGTGALGLLTARWLVRRGARHLVLTGRTEPSPSARAAIDALAGDGAHVVFRAADAGDRDAVLELLDGIVASGRPLRGVVHAAGATDDGALVHQTWSRMAPILAGKGGGAQLLDELAPPDLDFFVMYSAGGSLLGAPGQGPYAAASAQLDALAWRRRAFGRQALSVGWGPWSEGGMAARLRDAGDHSWQRRGVGWLSTPAAFATLEALLDDRSTAATVMPVDWRRFVGGLPDTADVSRYEAVLTATSPASTGTAAPVATQAVVAGWRAAPPRDQRRLVIEHVAGQARHVIGLEPDFRFDTRAALKESGLDSLMAVELRNALTRSLGANLPATLLFDHPTLDQLATYLVDRFDLGSDAVAVAGPLGSGPEVATHDDLIGLTDDETEALLLAELGETGAG